MDKLKGFKNRLSLSVDKISFVSESSQSDIAPAEESKPSVVGPSSDLSSISNDIIDNNSACIKSDDIGTHTDSTADSFKEFSSVLKTATSKSLMDEVMKEVEKISESSTKATNSGAVQSTCAVSTIDQIAVSSTNVQTTQVVTSKNESRFNSVFKSSVTSRNDKVDRTNDKPIHVPDQTESATSGYFSDSASEEVQINKKQRKDRASTMSPIPRLFKFSRPGKQKENTNRSKTSLDDVAKHLEKRESIYSRIVKSTKRDGSVARSTKEPLYARIKPKLFGDSSFKPINPIRTNSAKGSVIRPDPVHPSDIVIDTNPSKEDFPLLSEVSTSTSTSSVLKSNYSVNLEESGQFSRRPLPSLPMETFMGGFTHEEKEKPCSKIIVRSKQILPSVPSIITISNAGYANTKSPITNHETAFIPLTSEESAELSKIKHLVRNESTIQNSSTNGTLLDEHFKDSGVSDLQEEDAGKSKLNRLVEELAQELESVSRRTGMQDTADEESNREVLMKLISHYDLPKAARPVENNTIVDDSFVPASDSPNELRYVDDIDGTMVYGDVPDYSQDEFFIAFDDENDPKYASLTRELQVIREGDSSDRISHRSTQMYANVVNVLSALKVLINSNSTKAATVISRMGTLARPYTNKVHTSINDTTWIQRRLFHKTGHHGFDELRRYIKSGGEFCKELAVIMHERAELESSYAKSLHKLSTKLLKASRDSLGTISEAWQAVGSEFEHEGDVHRIFASSLTDDVVRPLRQIIESQYKVRKGVEGIVDKSTKNLQDWRTAEVKAKKTSFHNTRESEKVQDMLIDARLNRGKALSEKDIFKLEKQRKKAEEAVKKSDLEYYNFCVRAERSRQDWESAIYKGSNCFQTLEEERLASLQDLVKKYHTTRMDCMPKLVVNAERLKEPLATCDVEKDIQTIISAKGSGENLPEQNLPDFFAEDFDNPMNKTRRREALEKFVGYLRTDLDRERKGKQGVENLAKALQETPKFGGEDSKQDVNDKLQHMKAMLAYLEASRYKVQSSLDELDSRPRSMHPLAKHIDVRRDKQGYPSSILKFPSWEKGGSTNVSPLSESPESSPNWNDRGTADGNSVQPDSDFVEAKKVKNNFELTVEPMPANQPKAFMYPYRYPFINLPTDEFSSQGSDHDYQNAVNEVVVESAQPNFDVSEEAPKGYSMSPIENMPDGTYYARPLTIPSSPRCKALYDYDANLYDELTIKTGDIINIHEKQPDGWWLGELEGVVGIFPATYVQAIDYP